MTDDNMMTQYNFYSWSKIYITLLGCKLVYGNNIYGDTSAKLDNHALDPYLLQLINFYLSMDKEPYA